MGGGRGDGSGDGRQVEFCAAAFGGEFVAVFFQSLARDGGAARVFADRGEEVVELDGGVVAEAGLQAEVSSGRGHGEAMLVGITGAAVLRYRLSREVRD